MKIPKSFLLVLLLAHFLWGCTDGVPEIADPGYGYFPLQAGSWIEYDVDSITFSDVALPVVLSDTLSFQIREEVGAAFTDNSGEAAYRIERLKRYTDSESWQVDRIWTASRTDLEAIRTEDNLRFVKLVFPLQEGTEWPGNAFVPVTANPGLAYLADWSYHLTELDKKGAIGSFTWDSTLTVLQTDEENLIERTYSVEQYARDVGLVYKEVQVLFKQNVTVGWDKPEAGIILRQRIRDYGD